MTPVPLHGNGHKATMDWFNGSFGACTIGLQVELLESVFSDLPSWLALVGRSLLSSTDFYRTPTDSIGVLDILLSIQKL